MFYKRLKPFKTSQNGMSSIYIIIFIIMTALAITLSGGGNSLFTGNTGTFITPTVTPNPFNPSGVPAGSTISPSPAGSWSINPDLAKCTTTNPPSLALIMKVFGMEDGYVQLSVDNPTKIILTQDFVKPTADYSLTLKNSDGFNTSSWKFEVFSGGTKTGSGWSGGILRKTYNGSPTGC